MKLVISSHRAAGQRILRRAGAWPRGPLVRSLPEPGQAKRRVQLRLVRRRSVHPDELPARRARPRVHAGPRGRATRCTATTRPSIQPYQYYNYTIFVAEVASTFNEQLLSQHLMSRPRATQERAYLVNREIDAIRGTIIRQTMFAEFERTHARPGRSRRAAHGREVQERIPQAARAVLRPRFRDRRRAVAGMPPHPALLSGVLRLQIRHRPVGRDCPVASACSSGGRAELDDYLAFSQGGCSKYPLDLLRDAGVDMEQPGPSILPSRILPISFAS